MNLKSTTLDVLWNWSLHHNFNTSNFCCTTIALYYCKIAYRRTIYNKYKQRTKQIVKHQFVIHTCYLKSNKHNIILKLKQINTIWVQNKHTLHNNTTREREEKQKGRLPLEVATNEPPVTSLPTDEGGEGRKEGRERTRQRGGRRWGRRKKGGPKQTTRGILIFVINYL